MWSEADGLPAPVSGLRDGGRSLAAPVLAIASLVWLMAVFAAPLAARRAAAGSPLAIAAGTVYLAGSIICHQQARRSFHFEGIQLPVCARCTGIYAAAPFGLLCAWLFRRRTSARRNAARDPARWRNWLIAAALPTAITVLVEWVSGTMVPGPVRAAAGVPIGFVVTWYLGECLSSEVRRPASGVR